MNRIIDELQTDPRIHSIQYTQEVGTLLIHFAPEVSHDLRQIEEWLKTFDTLLNSL
ncbi:hypothetical protein [Paenibacillus turpanensis]|uniref:hypothetical protein n=1 Tax=Paenibacillus turpanensis TaxID=2689078 RepID=UPI001407CB66|nr:hypothetical protein [Paenibacillus turpanensis]